jgi:hypothetical protein
MDEAKNQLVKKVQESANVLVTVSANPSVDQLAACIGFTIVLNKLGKHATAVFSGKVPDTIEFLKPDETLENNTDSLRDFIISLDKSKADKLRYKVEDKVVKIFITPYRTSIGQQDLEFSQGDFNVDAVIAVGVHDQKDLDQAITAHGRILHDATIISVNRDAGGSLGALNWMDNTASSLCEMLVAATEQLKADIMDEQIATAYLTGIVAETQRFSNERTTSNTMNISARLMAAGANQQLVATKLQEHKDHAVTEEPHFDPLKMNELAQDEAATVDDEPGSLRIDHAAAAAAEPAEAGGPLETNLNEPQVDDERLNAESKLILEPPSMGGTLTASTTANVLDPSTDPLSLPILNQPLLSHDGPAANTEEQSQAQDPPLPDLQSLLGPVDQPEPPAPSEPSQTLTQLEESVNSPHLDPNKVTEQANLDQSEPPAEEENKGGMHVIDPLPAEPHAPLVMPADENKASSEPQAQDETPTEPALPELNGADSAETLITPTIDPGQMPETQATPDVDEARDAVLQAINASTDPGPLQPVESLNAQPIELNTPQVDEPAAEAVAVTSFDPTVYGIDAAGVTGEEFKMPENLIDPNAPLPPDPTAASVTDPTAPPLVPPPLYPPAPMVEDGSDNTDQPPQINPFNLPPNA